MTYKAYNAKEIGHIGERVASHYLAQKQYKIIARNFRIRGGEIDIVAIFDQTVVFIEVKARTSQTFGQAQEAITPHKLRFLERAALTFCTKHPHIPQALRFDAIAIDLDDWGNVQSLRHYENITM